MKFIIFAILFLGVESLDLLGIQLSVPALEKEGAVTNLLGQKHPSQQPSQTYNPQTNPQYPHQQTNPQISTNFYQPPSAQNPSNANVYDVTKPVIVNHEDICIESKTKINGGKNVCSGSLLFEDHFNTGKVNLSKWERQQYIADSPDFEFVTYEKRAQNCYISDGVLHLKATLRDDPIINAIDLSNGCTSRNCTLSIGPNMPLLPPIIAGKIKSKFSFLYGKIEIRAKLPKGDWLFPHVNLDPKGYFSYENGRLWIAYARGNSDLKREETLEQIGNNILYAGGVLDENEPIRTYATLKINSEQPWGDDFHIYTLIWTPDGITVVVDGKEKGHISPPFTNSGSPYSVFWEGMAPFDEEFVISLGISAGGFSDFPEGSTSNGNRKPWKRNSVRPVVKFYEARNQWYPTWSGDNSELQIDYVKVWAL